MRTFSGQLWRRVIGRRACIEGLVRPRAPLVFARRSPSEIVPARAGSSVKNEFRLALSFDFSWPTWIVDARSWLEARPSVTAPAARIRVARPLAFVARRAASRGAVVPDTGPGLTTATASPSAPRQGLRAVRPPSQAVDRRTSTDVPHRHVFPRLDPVAAGRVVGPRTPIAARPAGIAVHRGSPSRTAPAPIAPLAAARRARPAATPEPQAAVPLESTLVKRTVTRLERATEVVHHRTSYEQPVTRVLRKEVEAPAPSAASPSPERSVPARSIRPPVPAPAIDVERLSDEVYRHIQRRVRIERERRGA